MQTVQFVLVQLDDAARHLSDGRLGQLRVALLLLDNAAEVLLHRWAKNELGRDAQTRRLYSNAKRWGAPDSFLASFDTANLLSPTEEKKVLRLFDRLVDYAVTRDAIAVEIGDALVYLHRYRTEAYHRASVRDATIRTSVVLFFDIVCRLVLSDIGHVFMTSSAEDYSWLSDRFGVPAKQLFPGDELRRSAIKQLRTGLPPEATNISEAMASHLESRVEELLESLTFVSTTARDLMTHEEVLTEAIRYVDARRDDPWVAEAMPLKYSGRVSLDVIDKVKVVAGELRRETREIEAFRKFAQIELELEHLEYPVFELAAAVDSEIQLQVDIARGK